MRAIPERVPPVTRRQSRACRSPVHPAPVRHTGALALLGDVLNDLDEHRDACRAWRAAEARGARMWRALAAPWVTPPASGGAFGAREPLRSLAVDGPPIELRRASGTGGTFRARRVANTPSVFVLEGFSTAEERRAIIDAAVDAPMRQVPAAEDDAAEDDVRAGCEVAWLPSPLTSGASAWATLMRDAEALVLPRGRGLPPPAGAEDLHVVKYAPGGAYGLHLDATCAVPRAVTVLHYLNDVDGGARPGYGGETWLPYATSGASAEAAAADGPVAGRDGVLVAPRAGDVLVFFSFDEFGGVEAASLHGGRPSPSPKWVANQWIRLELEGGPPADGASDEREPAAAAGADGDGGRTGRELNVPRGPGFGPRVIG